MAVRLEKVEGLVEGMLNSLEGLAADTTASEVVSAVMTLTRRTVRGFAKRNPESREQLREAIELILMECATDERN